MRPAPRRLGFDGDGRHARGVVGVTAEEVVPRADEIGRIEDAEELRRRAVHPVVGPQPVQGESQPQGGVSVAVEQHLQRGPTQERLTGRGIAALGDAIVVGADGVHHALEGETARGAGRDVADVQGHGRCVGALEPQRVPGHDLGGDTGSGDSAPVGEGEGVGDDVAVAHGRVLHVHEGEALAQVGQAVGVGEGVPQPEEAVAHEAVGRASRRRCEAELQIGIHREGLETGGVVGADAWPQAGEDVGMEQLEDMIGPGEFEGLDDTVAVDRVHRRHGAPQPHGVLLGGEGYQHQRRGCGVGDPQQVEGDVEIGQSAP